MNEKKIIDELREFVSAVKAMTQRGVGTMAHLDLLLEDKLTELEQKYCGKSVREQMEKHGLNVKDTNDIEVNVLCGKRFEEDMDIEPQQIDMGNISDGYHTFNELYEHRSLLYLAWMLSDGRPGDCYWIADHFEGWDLLVCGRGNIKSPATQISYHIPVKYREYLQKAFPCINKEEYIWDGHTSDDVLERIKTWMKHDLARW